MDSLIYRWEDTLRSLGISLISIFVVTFFMMGLDFTSSFISLIVIMMILINLCGMMYWYVDSQVCYFFSSFSFYDIFIHF